MMDLVIRHEFNCCIGEDAEECSRMALKEASNAGLSIDIVSCAECTNEGAYVGPLETRCKIRTNATHRHISESQDLRPGKGF
jgi:hypothetical protein